MHEWEGWDAGACESVYVNEEGKVLLTWWM